MQEILISMVEKYGYLGVSLLILVENIFPPIPSEGILLFGGFAASQSLLNIWIVILSATIGSVVGAIVLYYIGFLLGKERLMALTSGKIGRILHLEPESVEKADGWFHKYGAKAVFVCRCIPVLRSLVSIPAGISKMNMSTFLPLTIIGSSIWNIIVVWLGYWAGDAWHKIEDILGVYSDIVLAILIVLVVVAFIIFSIKRRKKKELDL